MSFTISRIFSPACSGYTFYGHWILKNVIFCRLWLKGDTTCSTFSLNLQYSTSTLVPVWYLSIEKDILWLKYLFLKLVSQILCNQIVHKFYCSILILLSLKDYFKVKYHIYKWQFSFLIFLSFAMIQHSSFIILLFFRFSYFTYRCNFFWNCFNWIYF